MKREYKFSVGCLAAMLLISILYLLPVIVGGTKQTVVFAEAIRTLGAWPLTGAALGSAILSAAIGTAIAVICAPSAAWYAARVGGGCAKILTGAFVFAIIVPDPLIRAGLCAPLAGLPVSAIGLGAGLMFLACFAYIRLLPVEAEETAAMEGFGAARIFFGTVMPMLRPVVILMGAACAAWILNDCLQMGAVTFVAVNAATGILLAVVFAVRLRKIANIEE